jgi:hypothetical protein
MGRLLPEENKRLQTCFLEPNRRQIGRCSKLEGETKCTQISFTIQLTHVSTLRC